MEQPQWTRELREFGAIAPRRALSEQAADILREFILLGKLAPGVPVAERDLAEALGISRTPLKEALRILKNEGLIVYGPTNRPRVADPSLEELTQNLNVLGVLEGLAGQLACRHATDAEVESVAELEARMREASDDTDSLAFFGWDMEFHQTIVRAARNDPLLETHRTYNARLWRARFISSRSRTARDRTLGQHGKILHALQARDGRKCSRQMRRHLESAVANIAASLSESGPGEGT